MSARFLVQVRAGYRNPLHHGIRGADRYSVILSAPDQAAAALGPPAWCARTWPFIIPG